jgi:KDO2-lipid IV(A) lauroyltransferase
MINLYYAAQHPFTAMYKPPRKPVLAALMLSGRQRGQATLVPTDLSGVRAQLAALKRREAIGILPDQVASRGDGVWAPFFGRPAYTPTQVASLQPRPARRFCRCRRSWGAAFTARFRWRRPARTRPRQPSSSAKRGRGRAASQRNT